MVLVVMTITRPIILICQVKVMCSASFGGAAPSCLHHQRTRGYEEDAAFDPAPVFFRA